MSNNYTETELQLILNKITSAQANTITMNEGELYLAPDDAVYSVNNVTPTNGNVNIPEGANKDLSNLSSTGNSKFQAPITGGASTITSSNLTTNRALVSNSRGKVAVSSVTLSELGYVSGVTSNIQTQLNGKADVDLSNVASSKGILTESYVNGTSWYRVYSDGWCEQGGELTSVTDATVTFLKPFTDTNYLITTGGYDVHSPDDFAYCTIQWRNKTTTTVRFQAAYNGTAYVTTIDWQACGYIN